jgi:hypothetical protein
VSNVYNYIIYFVLIFTYVYMYVYLHTYIHTLPMLSSNFGTATYYEAVSVQ